MSHRPRVITRKEQEQAGLLRQPPSNYVPASDRRSAPGVTVTAHAYPVVEQSTLPVQTHVEVKTSHLDRAYAWRAVMTPVAWLVALSTLLIAYLGGQVELLSIGAIALLVATATIVWVLGFLFYSIVSPDGASFFSSMGYM